MKRKERYQLKEIGNRNKDYLINSGQEDKYYKIRKQQATYLKIYNRKERAVLSDNYIKGIIVSQTKTPRDNIPQSFIDLYRKLIEAKRLLNQKGVPKERKRLIDLRYKLKRKINTYPSHPKINEWKERLRIADTIYYTHFT